LFCCSFRNEGATCYLISDIQALMGYTNWVEEVKAECSSTMLDSLKSVIAGIEARNNIRIYRALQTVRIRSGRELSAEFKSHTRQNDCEEWLSLFMQTVDLQIRADEVEQRIYRPVTFIDRYFKIELVCGR
jgi:uncharacterized UBP type Zn finger protein